MRHMTCLPAYEACNGIIDLTPQGSNFVAVLGGDPSVDGGDHLVPVDGHVDCHYRRYDQKRHEREECVSPRPERAQNVTEPMAAAADDRSRGLVKGSLMPNDLAQPGMVCVRRESLNVRE